MSQGRQFSSPKAELIAIGTELAAGLIADTNSQYLSQRLFEEGIWPGRHAVIADIPRDILAALEAAARSQIVIATGGLGPTLDDLTRQCVAKFARRPLELRADVLASIEAFFKQRQPHHPMPRRNRVQAMLPRGAEVLPNSVGTAAGFRIAVGRSEIIVLPGVPAEMKEMFETHVVPYLRSRYPHRPKGITRRINSFGAPESFINERLRDILGSRRNADVGTIASGGVIGVRISVMGDEEEKLQSHLDALQSEVQRRLKDYVFGTGDDRLEHAVARELEARSVTLAVAESCTGGLITHWLTNVPGISRFLLEGQVTYSNDSKVRRLGVTEELIRRHGAVSAEVAHAMANGVRGTAGADYGLSVTGIAGPSGGTPQKPVGLCYVGCASEHEAAVSEHRLGGSREAIKDRAAKYALYRLLRFLQGTGGSPETSAR